MSGTTKISAIVAMSSNRILGNNGQLPWHFRKDLEYFKALTIGATIVMGKNTFLSLGKPLPNRKNVILSHHHIDRQDIIQYGSLDKLISDIKLGLFESGVFIIGGAVLLEQTLKLGIVDRIYCTLIHGEFVGDVSMPSFEGDYALVESSSVSDTNKVDGLTYELEFRVYDKIHL